MAHAAVTLKPSPHYRIDAFMEGFKRLGYDVGRHPSVHPRPQDVILVWNRHGYDNAMAEKYLKVGATVFVTENGYLGKDERGHQLYAIARTHHNGAGHWHVGNKDRWSRLGIELKPWRTDGKHILVLPQRGIGPKGVAMPSNWIDGIMPRIKFTTQREVRLRTHPGMLGSKEAFYEDLVDCWAVVTWGSTAALKALVEGIPVFYDFPKWIGAEAAAPAMGNDWENPWIGDRLPMFRRLSWAQWTVEEIAEGLPFRERPM